MGKGNDFFMNGEFVRGCQRAITSSFVDNSPENWIIYDFTQYHQKSPDRVNPFFNHIIVIGYPFIHALDYVIQKKTSSIIVPCSPVSNDFPLIDGVSNIVPTNCHMNGE